MTVFPPMDIDAPGVKAAAFGAALRQGIRMGDANMATAGVAYGVGIDADFDFVLSPPKVIDAGNHGMGASATAAGNASGFALAYAIARLAGAALMLPNGVMNCDQISVPYYSFGTQVSIFANPGRKTVLKKATADGNGLFQLSEPTAAGYTALLRFSNITFEGYAGNSAFAFRGYDLARCFFDNCQFNKALIGLDLKGGIGNSFFKCTVTWSASTAKDTLVATMDGRTSTASTNARSSTIQAGP